MILLVFNLYFLCFFAGKILISYADMNAKRLVAKQRVKSHLELGIINKILRHIEIIINYTLIERVCVRT